MKKRLLFFSRKDTPKAAAYAKKLGAYIQKRHPSLLVVTEKPNFVIALGGDGTILEAARLYGRRGAIIVGFNLGHVGFLASARRPREFTKAIDMLAHGKYTISKRMMVTGTAYRGGKAVYQTESLNEIALQGLSGGIKLTVAIDGHPLQYVRGNGVLVATPTGSTAYNLSAHGPIVTPDIQCFIVTEILDHHIPTPSIVVKRTKTIEILVTEIRQKGLLTATATGEAVDAVLTSDDTNIFPLREGDRIVVGKSKHLIKFAEFASGYFFTSLQEKFAFR